MIEMREVKADDSKNMWSWRNLPEVSFYMYNDHEISLSEHEKWFSKMLVDESCKYWIIVLDGQDVGVVNLAGINLQHSRCEWGFYLVSPEVRGKGVGSYIEYCVLKYVFEELKLNRLCGEVLDFNESVLRMHKKYGFVEEGRLREHIIKGNVAHDVTFISMLRSEWETIHKAAFEKELASKGLV